MSSAKEEEIKLYLSAITTRDPSKRQIKAVDANAFQLFEDLDSGSDEEFVVNSDDSSAEEDDNKSESDNENGETNSDNNSSEKDEAQVCSEIVIKKDVNMVKSENEMFLKRKLDTIVICMICLMDVNYSDNELIECDGCGIVVHEDCYKICDNVFMSCDSSDASTDPWFCDPCLNNIKNPKCELCPVFDGGVFKRTENNRWVHLLCALYTPGVAFNDIENLSEVTLSELSLKDWSNKECCYCKTQFFAKTGVCIGCDAGLCKNYFHVSCAQKEGLLSEPNIDENPDDPFFAQCMQHTNKETARRRQKNWITARNTQKVKLESWNKNGHFEDVRLHRKLEYFSALHRTYKELIPTTFIPLEKIPCYLETNPIAVDLFKQKAENLRLPQDVLNSYTIGDFKMGTGVPIFSADFVTYFVEREKKIDEMNVEVMRLESLHRDLQISEQNASHQYNKIIMKKESVMQEFKSNLDRLNVFSLIFKNVSVLPKLSENVERIFDRYIALSKDEKYIISNVQNDNNNVPVISIINECSVCNKVSDQHLMIDCNNCLKFCHLSCLDPPLERMPKKNKQCDWQCSKCAHNTSDEGSEKNVDVNLPRQLRKTKNIFSKYKDSENSNETSNLKRRLLKRKYGNLNNSSDTPNLKSHILKDSNKDLSQSTDSSNMKTEILKKNRIFSSSNSSSVNEDTSKDDSDLIVKNDSINKPFSRRCRSKKKVCASTLTSHILNDSNIVLDESSNSSNLMNYNRKNSDESSDSLNLKANISKNRKGYFSTSSDSSATKDDISKDKHANGSPKTPFVSILTYEENGDSKVETDETIRSCRSKKMPSALLDEFGMDGVSSKNESCNVPDQQNVKVSCPRPIHNLSKRYQRKSSLNSLIEMQKQLQKNEKNIPFKRKNEIILNKPIVLVEKYKVSTEEGLIKEDVKVMSYSESEPRKSCRSKKRPISFLDEFEMINPPKKLKHSKKLIKLSKTRGSTSLTPDLKKTTNEEPRKSLIQQFITFYPSPAKSDPSKTDQVLIGLIAKKPIITSRENEKILEKKPVMIKWHGDQDDDVQPINVSSDISTENTSK